MGLWTRTCLYCEQTKGDGTICSTGPESGLELVLNSLLDRDLRNSLTIRTPRAMKRRRIFENSLFYYVCKSGYWPGFCYGDIGSRPDTIVSQILDQISNSLRTNV